MIVHLSAEAAQDIEAIGDYIAADNPVRAISFVREQRAKCQQLAELPNAYPLVAGYEAEGVRRRRHGNYLIFYRVEAAKLIIIHVLHGARDHNALLLPGAF